MTSQRIGDWRRHLGVTLLGLVAWSIAGCNGDGGGGEPGKGGPEKVMVDGSSTVFRISRAAQLGFSKVEPNIDVPVAVHGTSGGFERYLNGEVDIIDASRDAKPEETKQAESKGYLWTRFLVGYDGITVVVNPKNTFAKSLTVAQLKSLYAPDSQVTNWNELDPSWPAQKIILYAPDTSSGTFDYFTEEITGKGIKKHRPDVQQSEDDNQLVAGVSGDEYAIGYFGYPYYASNKDKLRAVPIQNGADAQPVSPSPETIIDRSYKPLARPLYIFVKNESMKRAGVAKFVKYYVENVVKLAESAGYVAPTADDLAANKAALEKLTSASAGGA